eukprot:587210-Pleurochrysis_carterae.AAC.2
MPAARAQTRANLHFDGPARMPRTHQTRLIACSQPAFIRGPADCLQPVAPNYRWDRLLGTYKAPSDVGQFNKGV